MMNYWRKAWRISMTKLQKIRDEYMNCNHNKTVIWEPHLAGARKCLDCKMVYNPNRSPTWFYEEEQERHVDDVAKLQKEINELREIESNLRKTAELMTDTANSYNKKVIEKSVEVGKLNQELAEAMAENAKLDSALQELVAENEQLKEKLAIAVEALEIYAAKGFYDAVNGMVLDEESAKLVYSLGKIARETLEKLK